MKNCSGDSRRATSRWPTVEGGTNIAITKGRGLRGRLLQLIQYVPATAKSRRRCDGRRASTVLHHGPAARELARKFAVEQRHRCSALAQRGKTSASVGRLHRAADRRADGRRDREIAKSTRSASARRDALASALRCSPRSGIRRELTLPSSSNSPRWAISAYIDAKLRRAREAARPGRARPRSRARGRLSSLRRQRPIWSTREQLPEGPPAAWPACWNADATSLPGPMYRTSQYVPGQGLPPDAHDAQHAGEPEVWMPRCPRTRDQSCRTAEQVSAHAGKAFVLWALPTGTISPRRREAQLLANDAMPVDRKWFRARELPGAGGPNDEVAPPWRGSRVRPEEARRRRRKPIEPAPGARRTRLVETT
jgi:hypothetical protein